MTGFVQHLLSVFLGLGLFGPIIFGVLDSSLLVLPFGNDLLVVLLVAGKKEWFAVYAAAATAGSVAGTFFLDLLSRKGGEVGLSKLMRPKKFDQIKNSLGKRAGVAVFLACVAPPPFPFTPVIAGASAFQYPRKRLPGFVAIGRALRFFVLALAALWIGRRVLSIMHAAWFEGMVIAIIVIGGILSVLSVRRLMKSRRA